MCSLVVCSVVVMQTYAVHAGVVSALSALGSLRLSLQLLQAALQLRNTFAQTVLVQEAVGELQLQTIATCAAP